MVAGRRDTAQGISRRTAPPTKSDLLAWQRRVMTVHVSALIGNRCSLSVPDEHHLACFAGISELERLAHLRKRKGVRDDAFGLDPPSHDVLDRVLHLGYA